MALATLASCGGAASQRRTRACDSGALAPVRSATRVRLRGGARHGVNTRSARLPALVLGQGEGVRRGRVDGARAQRGRLVSAGPEGDEARHVRRVRQVRRHVRAVARLCAPRRRASARVLNASALRRVRTERRAGDSALRPQQPCAERCSRRQRRAAAARRGRRVGLAARERASRAAAAIGGAARARRRRARNRVAGQRAHGGARSGFRRGETGMMR